MKKSRRHVAGEDPDISHLVFSYAPQEQPTSKKPAARGGDPEPETALPGKSVSSARALGALVGEARAENPTLAQTDVT